MRVRCPHCNNPIEIVGDDELSDVTCPTCGSDFSLLPETEGYSPTRRTIGHFELVEQLGTGGFGTVWKAKDSELDRFVAVKIPRREQVEPENVEMFLREARAAAQLKHPQIVAVHEVGRDEGTLYIVSDYIQGVTLADRLALGPFTPRESADLCAQIADALQHAHEAGVIHRDLKPQNIMLDGEGRPHIMDFGLAKREAGEITMTVDGKVLGTAAYMSPEQARGEAHRVDRRTDVYSLGVVLFELLTGERPFRGNRAMLLHQVINEESPSPRKLNARLPRDLETIALKCLEKDPRRRYATAQAVGKELRHYLSGQPIEARPISSVERSWRWSRRNPAGAALLATLVFGLLTTTALSWWALNERARADTEALSARTNEREAIASAEREAAERKRAVEQTIIAVREADAAWANQYIAHTNRIELDWENANLGRIIDTLEVYRQPPPGRKDLRGWEWHFQDRLCNREIRTFPGHDDRVMSVAFSADGNRIATAGHDDTVVLWDATTWANLHKLPGHTKGAWSVAFSPDGTTLASGSGDGTVRLWDVRTGQEVKPLGRHAGTVYSVVFSPDGSRLASGSLNGTIKFWDLAAGRAIRTIKGHAGGVQSIAYGPNGIRLASAGSDSLVKLWNVNTGKEVRAFTGHTGAVMSVAFNPEGTQMASSATDGTVRVWNPYTGQPFHTLSGHRREVYGVQFSPDGRLLASSSHDRTIKLWDPATGALVREIRGNKGPVYCVAFCPDGTRLAAAGNDREIKLWPVFTDPEQRVFRGHTAGLYSVEFSPDSTQVASGSVDNSVKLWDATTGQEVRTLRGHTGAVQRVAYSPDGTWLASASHDGTVKTWDLETGRELRTFQGHTQIVQSVAISPDGTLLASAGLDHTVRLWDAATGATIREITGHMRPVISVAFSTDGKRLASGGADRMVRVWDASSGRELLALEGHTSGVLSVAFSPDGKHLASSGGDGRIILWEASTGQSLRTLKQATMIQEIKFNADGSRLISGAFTGEVTLWDVATGQEIRSLARQSRRVYGVAFSPDGTRIAAASNDHLVTVWDARPLTAELRAELEAVSELDALFKMPLPAREIQTIIERDQLLSDVARTAALKLVGRFQEEADPQRYYDAAWPIIRHLHSGESMCRVALAQMTAACERAADQPKYRIAKALAQFRLGTFDGQQYAASLETLKECDQNELLAQLVLAMIQGQMGQTTDGQAVLDKAVQALDAAENVDPELHRLRVEATQRLRAAAAGM